MYPTANNNTVGHKDNNNKPRIDLIEPEFILGLGEVLGFGAKKYAENSWQNEENAENSYYAAAMRHLLAYRMGEAKDEESGRSHLEHAAANIMFLAHFEREAK